MTTLDPHLEEQLRAAARRFKWLRFWSALALLGTAWSGAVLLLGVAIWRGWVRHPLLAVGLAALSIVLASIGLVVLGAFAAASSRPRSWLAQALESVHRPFLDRLNTLVFLEPTRGDAVMDSYFRRIESQASRRAWLDAIPSPFPGRPVARRWAVCATVLVLTVAFYARFQPWEGLHFADEDTDESSPREAAPEVAPPEADTVEANPAWGEVRITEPGRDLKVTKVDVVPLQIEAAASQALEKALWFTATGGAEKKVHVLPPPSEPHYAVFKPMLYVDELRLAEWDVLTYFATASTKGGLAYASEIYFLEVRPFREDIMKLRGGEGGKAYRALAELTELIDRQKHVIRETHGHLQRADDSPTLKRQDLKKLEGAEGDLAEAARHLYAKIAASMENQDVGVVLDHLARAEDLLSRAARTLASAPSEAPGPEQEALTELVATRKRLQKVLSDDPGAMGDGDAERPEAEDSPVADMPDKLKRIAEFRNEEKAVRDLLDKAVDEQRRIAQRAQSGGPPSYPALAEEQKELRRSLEEFANGHPRLFKGAEKEKGEADAALSKATESLETSKEGAAAEQKRALEALQELRKTVGRRTEERQLAHAYRLRELLDEHAKEIAKIEAEPGGSDDGKAQDAASSARDTTRELKKVMDETPAGEAFGPPLKEALGDEKQRGRERKLDALSQSRGAEARKRAAGPAKEALQELSQAFDRSAPDVVKDLRKADPLKPGGKDALERALRQLESLAATGDGKRPASPEDGAKQRREALENLREGAEGLYGKNERTRKLILRVQEELERAETKIDAARLRKLLDEIERFRVEMSEARLAQREALEVRHIDASKLPPAYRERIQRYFQKLSEQ